jgi:CBS domain-containing protein
MLVKEVLKVKGNTLYTVSPDTQLSDAVISMSEHDIGSVVVMQQGKLADAGTHAELLQRSETYQTLWNQQTSHL